VTWSYSGNPGESEKDAVRFAIPDNTVQTALSVSDEEITYTLEEEGSVLGASAACCESIGRRLTMQADLSTGDLKLTYSKQAETFAQRAKDLRLRAQGSHAPTSAGLSISEKEGFAEDTDEVQPLFRRGQFSSPGAGGMDDGEGGVGEAELGEDI
jgi:hypothetical protein